jgi:hypothetical protein
MKKILLILTLLFTTSTMLFAQDDEVDGKIRDKMREYIQQRMRLNPSQAERFSPVFLRYFHEWRTTLRDNRGGDKLFLQQKIIELRIRYRTEFKDIVGERRCNEIYDHQDRFVREIKDVIRRERMQNRPVLRRNRALL